MASKWRVKSGMYMWDNPTVVLDLQNRGVHFNSGKATLRGVITLSVKFEGPAVKGEVLLDAPLVSLAVEALRTTMKSPMERTVPSIGMYTWAARHFDGKESDYLMFRSWIGNDGVLRHDVVIEDGTCHSISFERDDIESLLRGLESLKKAMKYRRYANAKKVFDRYLALEAI